MSGKGSPGFELFQIFGFSESRSKHCQSFVTAALEFLHQFQLPFY